MFNDGSFVTTKYDTFSIIFYNEDEHFLKKILVPHL